MDYDYAQMKDIKTDKSLKNFLAKKISEVNEQDIEEGDMKVLIMPKNDEGGAPVREIYFSENCTDEIGEMFGEVPADVCQNNEAISKMCAACENEDKKYIVKCQLLNEAVNYYGIVQFVLNEIKEGADYPELRDEQMLLNFFECRNLGNRTLLMENYAQKFLSDNGLPTAELLIELSARRYEGSESEAKIYVDNASIENNYKVCIFDKTGSEERVLKSENLRTVRKLMEMSKSRKLQLLADCDMKIIGLISVCQEAQDKINGQSNYICFNGYMQWSIYIKGKEEICYRQGKYYINSSGGKDTYEMKVNEFRKRSKGKISELTVQIIGNLVNILKQQRHGTAVILTEDEEEAPRLCRMDRGILLEAGEKQAFKTAANEFVKERILGVTQIDGALYMDLNGMCTAFGVIVDGVARKKGNSGRGARYNSINNYICQKHSDKVYIALIFSEDGGVDIIDNFNQRGVREQNTGNKRAVKI